MIAVLGEILDLHSCFQHSRFCFGDSLCFGVLRAGNASGPESYVAALAPSTPNLNVGRCGCPAAFASIRHGVLGNIEIRGGRGGICKGLQYFFLLLTPHFSFLLLLLWFH